MVAVTAVPSPSEDTTVPSAAEIALVWGLLALGAYVALMFCYGVGNIANDAWLEQVVKRGRTAWEISSVLEPQVTIAWTVIVVAVLVGLALAIPRTDAVRVLPRPERA